VYFIFFSDGGAPKRRGARGSLPSLYPTFSTGLIKVHNTHSWIKCKVDNECILHLSIVLAIRMPKIIKFGGDLTKF